MATELDLEHSMVWRSMKATDEHKPGVYPFLLLCDRMCVDPRKYMRK